MTFARGTPWLSLGLPIQATWFGIYAHLEFQVSGFFFASRIDRPRHPQPSKLRRSGWHRPPAGGRRGSQQSMTGRDTARRHRSGGVAADGRQAVLVPWGPSGPEGAIASPTTRPPFPDSRRPAVAAKRVKVERH
ncbi:hypothetical protein GCM10027590_64620 [Nocardiopsis nanhaiensis]